MQVICLHAKKCLMSGCWSVSDNNFHLRRALFPCSPAHLHNPQCLASSIATSLYYISCKYGRLAISTGTQLTLAVYKRLVCKITAILINSAEWLDAFSRVSLSPHTEPVNLIEIQHTYVYCMQNIYKIKLTVHI